MLKKRSILILAVLIMICLLLPTAKYQIQYRVKGKSKWNSLTTKKRVKTIRKLRKGKRYQLRIRAFKKIGSETYHGAWSKMKKTRRPIR